MKSGEIFKNATLLTLMLFGALQSTVALAQMKNEMEAYCDQLTTPASRKKLSEAGLLSGVEDICKDLRSGDLDSAISQTERSERYSSTESKTQNAQPYSSSQIQYTGNNSTNNCTYLAKEQRIPVSFNNSATGEINTTDGRLIGRYYLHWLNLSRNTFGNVQGELKLIVINASSCVMHFNGSFFDSKTSRYPMRLVDFGAGFKVEPNSQKESSPKHFQLTQTNEMWFEPSTGFLSPTN